jgi:hypothetical protein
MCCYRLALLLLLPLLLCHPTSAMFSPILLSRQFPHQMPAPVPQLAHVVFLSMVFCLQRQAGGEEVLCFAALLQHCTR